MSGSHDARRALAGALLAAAIAGGCGKDAAQPPGGTQPGAGGAGGSGGAGAPDDGEVSTPPAPPYVIEAFAKDRITSDASQPNFQQANAELDLRDGPFAKVRLVVDLETTCYPFESWQDNPPPEGESWPADCDAFDRNFEFSLDDPEDPEVGPPGIELVRAITPFGGPLHLEVDITDVANGLAAGKHRLRAVIPTWSDATGQVSGSNGGWTVSAVIEAVPGPPPRKVLAVIPLFNGSQTTADGPGPLAVQVPEGTVSSRVEYRVTGHGGGESGSGCIGPAEEFCRRYHTILVDGGPLEKISPWRTDCEALCTRMHQGPADGGFDYCLENPCGAIESVEASRANWCPGSESPPFLWDAEALRAPGEHTLAWRISTVAEGGVWRISATYFAFGE
ncbi:peptide-N-glycosidase F-related protein (plasmid) [Sorangium sp. So ce119]|uniref:peptide-N-glycosidase F-related protein n=1 Tax=Sorangium sp. So ce119 TaxID=3133279 RepID=UPI003F62C3E4